MTEIRNDVGSLTLATIAREESRFTDTTVGGNRPLQHVYSLLHMHKRADIPPFLCFETIKTAKGTFMRFLGLACPGGEGVSALEDLVAVWRIKGESRFQNYRATLDAVTGTLL